MTTYQKVGSGILLTFVVLFIIGMFSETKEEVNRVGTAGTLNEEEIVCMSLPLFKELEHAIAERNSTVINRMEYLGQCAMTEIPFNVTIVSDTGSYYKINITNEGQTVWALKSAIVF